MGAWLSTKKVFSFSSQGKLSQKHTVPHGSDHGNRGQSFHIIHAVARVPRDITSYEQF